MLWGGRGTEGLPRSRSTTLFQIIFQNETEAPFPLGTEVHLWDQGSHTAAHAFSAGVLEAEAGGSLRVSEDTWVG